MANKLQNEPATIANSVTANTKLKIKYVSFILAFACGIGLIYYLRGVLFPFVGAFLIAYIVNPLVDAIEHKFRLWLRKPKFHKLPKRLARVAATIITLFLMVSAITLVCLIFIPQISEEFTRFGALITKFMADSTWIQSFLALIPSDWRSELQSFTEGSRFLESLQDINFWQTAQSMIGKLLPGAVGVFSGTVSVIITLVSIIFIAMYTTFLMLDMPKISYRIRILIPLKTKDKPDLLRKTNLLMKAYFRSQSLVALIVGILYALAFGIIGFPMGIVFGLFIGILNMVPYLQIASMPIAFFLGIIYSFDTGLPFWQVLIIIAAIYLVVQIVEDMFIIPRIVGTEMNLPPVLILLSISVWGKLLGFIGLVCAIPFTCIVIAIFQEYLEHRIFPRRQIPTKEIPPDNLEG